MDWRKRVGVEPTIHPAKGRIAGFEDREDHRTPFTSAYAGQNDNTRINPQPQTRLSAGLDCSVSVGLPESCFTAWCKRNAGLFQARVLSYLPQILLHGNCNVVESGQRAIAGNRAQHIITGRLEACRRRGCDWLLVTAGDASRIEGYSGWTSVVDPTDR
jgi:hypothetical protein